MRNCCTPASNKNSETPKPKPKQETILLIPGCKAHLIENEEPYEFAQGDFELVRLSEGNVVLATIVRVGANLRWPLTKDEPVVKLDNLHYLFSLQFEDRQISSCGLSFCKPNTEILSCGITFSKSNTDLGSLDSFLKENSCFSLVSTPSYTASIPASPSVSHGLDWKDYAPRIEDYHGFLARAIAGGTGEIIDGIFKCSNAFAAQVQNGAEKIRAGPKNGDSSVEGSKSKTGEKKSGVKKGLERAKKLSKVADEISQSLLDGVNWPARKVASAVAKSKFVGEAAATPPGQVLLATLDAVNKLTAAVDAAKMEAITATEGAATTMASNRFGKSAGAMTEDALEIAEHTIRTGQNISKLRRLFKPALNLLSDLLASNRQQRKG